MEINGRRRLIDVVRVAGRAVFTQGKSLVTLILWRILKMENSPSLLMLLQLILLFVFNGRYNAVVVFIERCFCRPVSF